MKTKLFTKNAIFLLLTFVLAFSLLGTPADALTFSTSRSGDLETKAPNETFTITFSVSLKGNTAIRVGGNLVKESGTEGGASSARIDSSGYLVGEATNGTEYRTIKAGTISAGVHVVDPRPRLSSETPNAAGSATPPFYVNTSKNVVDSTGKAVYVQTGGGTAQDPWTYTQAKAEFNDKVPDQYRYHYNEEAIKIDLEGPAKIIRVGSRTVDIDNATDLMMYERTHPDYDSAAEHQKLSGSVTLVLQPTGVVGGVVTVKVTDETPVTDAPTNGKSSPITFTLYSVKYQSNISTTNRVTTLAPDSVDYAFDNDVRPLGTYFTFVTDAEVPVHYSIDGSGTLSISQTYTDGSPTSVKTASKTLSTSSSAPVFIDMRRGTNKVTAWVSGGASQTMIFIYQGSSPTKYPEIEITGDGNGQTGAIQARLEEPLTVKVTDGNNRPLSGVTVGFTTTSGTNSLFIPVPGTRVWGSGTTLTTTAPSTDLVDTGSGTIPGTTIATSNTPNAGTSIFVKTDRNGVAQTYYQLGNATGAYQVTATLQGIASGEFPTVEVFDATAVAGSRSASLVIVSGNNQRSDKNTNDVPDPLVVRVRRPGGYRISNVIIRFTALIGALEAAPGTKYVRNDDVDALPSARQGYTPTGVTETDNNAIKGSVSGQEIFVLTNAHGEASVVYNAGQITGAKTVTGRINDEEANSQYDFQIRQVEFNIDGNTASTTRPPATTQPTTKSLSIRTTGEGETRSVTVTASDGLPIGVTLGGTALTASQVVTAGTATTITLPTTAGTYTLTATAPGYTAALETTVTVAAEALGTLSLARIGSAVNGQQTIQINARTAAGTAPSGTVNVMLSGAGVSKTVTTTATGSVSTTVTLPTTAGTVTASADGYTSGTLALPARTATTPTTTTPTTTGGGDPSRISVSGLATHSGTVNQELDLPLSVRVVDATGTGVEDARVIFRVRTGQGRLSQLGNGRATRIQTDSNGYARAAYTPMSARSTVEANAVGVTRTVTFTITADGSVPATTPGTTGTGTTPTEPKILVGAANRPAMVWIDSRILYELTGAEATKIAENVNDAAIGNGKVYWTEKTGASAGTIHSANLDGTGATKLATIMAVPMGIAVDTAGKKLYWTNSRGRVQSAALNGSGIRNVQQNLSSPNDIALGNGHIYWTEDGSSIRRVNMTGQKVVQDVAVSLPNVLGLAVGGGKVYWTEATGQSAGTINGANLNGTQFKTLATIKSMPMGIAVDTAGSKLYWTNSRGRVQSANLNGSKIQNVVDGLGAPSHIAIGSASEGITAAKPTKTATQPTKKDTSAYDVNGDGTVDNVDASLVSEAMGTDNKKFDVNGDGTVNFFDLMLVFDNRDEGAAGAPTIVGMQLSSVQIAIIEEQIDLLIATGDRSPAAMRTLVYLQQLLATARPEKTQLLANYPNPFNPETWLPYELATDTDVKITIYNAQGVVVRVLQLGQQSAGYYTDRDRAAYWDGQNALGEQVASGLYFYQLETDTMSAMRKMVILK